MPFLPVQESFSLATGAAKKRKPWKDVLYLLSAFRTAWQHTEGT